LTQLAPEKLNARRASCQSEPATLALSARALGPLHEISEPCNALLADTAPTGVKSTFELAARQADLFPSVDQEERRLVWRISELQRCDSAARAIRA